MKRLRDSSHLSVLIVVPWAARRRAACNPTARGALFDDVTALQYAGRCILHGVRLYDGVALPDGPFTFAFHTLLTVAAGTGAQAFRRVDLLVHALAGGAVGALLVPSPAPASRRAVWAAVSATGFVSLATGNDFWSFVPARELWFSHSCRPDRRAEENGELSILGRKKEMIVTPEGLNVFPEDVESVLNHSRASAMPR